MIGAAMAVAMMGLCTLVFAVTRATAVRRTFATSRRTTIEDLSLLHAVARFQRMRAAVLAVGSLAITIGVALLPVDAAARMALGVTPGLLVVIGAVSTWQLHRLVHLTPEPALRIVSHGQYLYAACGSRLVGWVAAPQRIRENATELPRARLHRAA